MPQFNFGPKVDAQDFPNQDSQENVDALQFNGPRLEVEIGWHKKCAGLLSEEYHAEPSPQIVLACIDTGATWCCITNALARKLQLPMIGAELSTDAGGEKQRNSYLGYVGIKELNHTWCTKIIGVDNVDVGTDGKTRFLIGRDILRHLLLTYDGPSGCLRLSFNK